MIVGHGNYALRVFMCGTGRKSISSWCFILTLALCTLRAENCGCRGPTASVVIGWQRMTSLTLIRIKFLEKTSRSRSTSGESQKLCPAKSGSVSFAVRGKWLLYSQVSQQRRGPLVLRARDGERRVTET